VHAPLVHAIGWFDGRYGYNVHTRGLFEALSRHLPVVSSPIVGLEGPQDADKPLVAQHFGDRPIASIALIYGSLMNVLKGASGTRIAYTVWESTHLPDDWMPSLAIADRIWTATPWGKRVFVANGLPAERIDVVPEGVDPALFNPEMPPTDGLAPTSATRFLAIGRWEKRKGISELIKAFDDEFGPDDNVELVVAGIHAHRPDLDLRAELRALRLQRPGRLKIIPTVARHSTFATLYTACDVFVAPTRAEGWGLPVIEAMACGLPTIVTGYGGPTAFIGTHAYRIDHRLVPVDVDFFERADGDFGEWAEPDWRHLRHLMRHVLQNPEEARDRGLRGSEHVRRHFSWDQAAARAADLVRRYAVVATRS